MTNPAGDLSIRTQLNHQVIAAAKAIERAAQYGLPGNAAHDAYDDARQEQALAGGTAMSPRQARRLAARDETRRQQAGIAPTEWAAMTSQQKKAAAKQVTQ